MSVTKRNKVRFQVHTLLLNQPKPPTKKTSTKYMRLTDEGVQKRDTKEMTAAEAVWYEEGHSNAHCLAAEAECSRRRCSARGSARAPNAAHRDPCSTELVKRLSFEYMCTRR